MKGAGRPMLKLVQGRLYSAQAAAKQAAPAFKAQKQAPAISKLPNGVVCVSLENYSPVTKVGIVYSCGPRYESGDNIGISHMLRNLSDQSTENASSFGIVRNVQQLGGSLSAQTTREHIIYQLECTRNQVDGIAEFLGHVATKPSFKPWEVSDCTSRTEVDLALYAAQPEIQLVEGVHKAAFRSTLGNSLYMARHKVGGFSPEQLHNYVSSNFTGQHATVVGLGIEHSDLVRLAKTSLAVAQLPSTSGSASTPEKVAYFGDQVRMDNNNSIVHAAIVAEGSSVTSKDVLTAGVLQKMLGTGPYVKYSDNQTGNKLMKAGSAAVSGPFSASCINFNYAETGLFGVHVVGWKSEVGKLLKAAMGEVAKCSKDGLNDADLKRGKAQLQAALHMDVETSTGLFDSMAKQAALTGEVFSPTDVSKAIDSVTLSDVKNLAMKVVNGKPSMAAVGNLSHTPYLEHLV